MENAMEYVNQNYNDINKLRYISKNLTKLASSNDKYVVRMTFDNGESKFKTLNINTLDSIKNLLSKKGQIIDTTSYFSSDPDYTYGIDNLVEFEVYKIDKRSRNNDGGYFKYINKTQFDLSRFQIYKDNKKPEYNCLHRALIEYSKSTNAISMNDVTEIIKNCKTDQIPKSYLLEIAKKYDIPIQLSEEAGDKIDHKQLHSKGTKPTFKIGLYKEHYFINDDIEIHTYAADNWQKLINEVDSHKIYRSDRGYYTRSNKYKARPIKIIKTLFDNNGFEPISEIDQIICKDNPKINLDNFIPTIYESKPVDMKYCRRFEHKLQPPDQQDEKLMSQLADLRNSKPTENNLMSQLAALKSDDRSDFDVCIIDNYEDDETTAKSNATKLYIIADCETYKDNNNVHKIYSHVHSLIYVKPNGDLITNNTETYLEGEDCIINFLNLVPDNATVYYHNLKYDWTQIYKHVYIKKNIKKEGQLYGAVCLYKGKTITFKDSYKMISDPLSKFGKSFNLDHEKAPQPYDLYNAKTIELDSIPFTTALKYVKDKDEFTKASEEYCYIDDDGIKMFRHMEYNEYYNKQDVKVLRNGMIKYRQIFKDEIGFDIFNFYSSASLADQYFISKGCYNGVYEYTGPYREFIQHAIRGGRVCSADNKSYALKGFIQDLDGVSLYPSAIKHCGGFPIGPPKHFTSNDFGKIADYYIWEIKIHKVNKNRKIPCLSYHDNEGKLIWSNELPQNTIVVDRFTLEDLIEFHQIEFDVIRGLYWDQGVNDTMCKEIQSLFDWRLKAKKDKNDLLQRAIKLLMNSAYGRTIMKDSGTNLVYKNAKDFDNFLAKNYNFIKQATKINDNCYEIEKYTSFDTHWTRTTVGCLILSYSKRIMNRVIYTAEDIGKTVYYTDTDSMHIFDKDIKDIELTYNYKYNTELIGKNLGQFHNDFTTKGYDKVISKQCIINGPKMYVDELWGYKVLKYDEDENPIETESELTFADYHIRLKGIPRDEIKYESNKRKLSPCDLYTCNEDVTFDLARTKPNFKYLKSGDVQSNYDFKRTIDFKNNHIVVYG